ncbi:hypothetical protein PISMIDRAFT_444426 [Pisolithus microcarpus 441]|uniref:Uncharacterized protein n=1 Tax=Pisolithus microcarpus 441 TaxID=765257 RepID=A0A0C9ZKG6_9AGAM|nr:hypothetical protein PISMIDRAFT_444426 [Pisolithus microcarpus 441]
MKVPDLKNVSFPLLAVARAPKRTAILLTTTSTWRTDAFMLHGRAIDSVDISSFSRWKTLILLDMRHRKLSVATRRAAWSSKKQRACCSKGGEGATRSNHILSTILIPAR